MVRATWVMVFVFPVFSVLAVEMDSLSLTTAICDDCGMTTWFGRVAAKVRKSGQASKAFWIRLKDHVYFPFTDLRLVRLLLHGIPGWPFRRGH